MTRDTRNRLIVFAVPVVVILAIAWAVDHRRADETPLERAYRLCGECGLDRDRVDQLVDDVAHSRPSSTRGSAPRVVYAVRGGGGVQVRDSDGRS